MEKLLSEKWEVKSKHSSTEALQRWRDLCGVVKNPKRRFRFTANLSKRYEADAIRKTIQEKLRIAVLVSKAAFQFIKGVQLSKSDYTVPAEVEAAGFQICADELGSIVENHDLKKLHSHGGPSGIAAKLATTDSNGLPTDDPEALILRQHIYGINKFTESTPRSFWVFFYEALQDMTLMILAVCAFVSLIVGLATEGWPKGAHDGLGIVASILLVVFVTATSDYRQSLQFKDLDKEKKKISVHVTRNGFRQKLSIYELLPGDVVHLAIGDQVPADGLFLSGFSVLIDESSLTGESEPVVVNEESPFLLSGTKVQDGACKMVVTTVGMRTQWGKLMATLSEGGDDETPLQVKLNGVATIIGKIGLFFAIVTFAVLVQKLVSRKMEVGSALVWTGDDALELLEYFAIAVTIVVVAVPEGLPLAVTLSLAFAMKKMMNDKALVRHLAACETMGSATTICSDKTGTLTTNHMTVVKSCIGMNIDETSKIPEPVVKILLQSIFNNTGGEVVINKDGKRETLGTPTETAILEFGLSLGGDFNAERKECKIVKVEPFNSTKKRMGVVLELPEGGGLRAHTKGASEIVLAACDKTIDLNGEVVPLDDASFAFLTGTIEKFADEALRTLCLAYVDLEDGFGADEAIPETGYTCIGIVGIKDPVRAGVRESVALCRSAGVTVRMVTGDNINTAKAIARECGILTDDGIAIEGPVFREKSLEELHELIPKLQVMARSSPLDKHTLVKHLRTTFNEVVAVTGDGTNDAPALHEADIGLAMGIAGTEVAKESADVIILDDNFSTIVTVAKWGRSVYVNIQKFVQFQLTVNIVALVVNFSSACLTAYLYRQLGAASCTGVRQMGGYHTLLEAWIYEHFPAFRCAYNVNYVAGQPLAIRWSPAGHGGASLDRVQSIREVLDLMTPDQVVWTPYDDAIRASFPLSYAAYYHGCISALDVVEPYHADRVLRQFGYVQPIPDAPIYAGDIPRNELTTRALIGSIAPLFDKWRSHILADDTFIRGAAPPWECLEDYMEWYCRSSHPIIQNPERRSSGAWRSTATIDDPWTIITTARGMMQVDIERWNRGDRDFDWSLAMPRMAEAYATLDISGHTEQQHAGESSSRGRRRARRD